MNRHVHMRSIPNILPEENQRTFLTFGDALRKTPGLDVSGVTGGTLLAAHHTQIMLSTMHEQGMHHWSPERSMMSFPSPRV